MSNTINSVTFGQHANAYAQHRPTYPAALFEWIASQAPARKNAWDCGCGNGQASIALAQQFEHVFATDVSAEQLSQASAHPRVTYQQAAAESAQLAPASMDAVCVATALHWFDLMAFWPIVQTALKPGGVFAAWTYGFMHIDPVIDESMKQELLIPLKPYWADGNTKALNGYRDMPFPFKEIEPPPTEMQMHWSAEQLMNYCATWSAVARMRKESGTDPIALCREKLVPLWGDAPRIVRMPLRIRAGLNQ
ncbi:MAG: class I SAM-dependent methyltransferase [Burkholderiaceae bacterium]